MNYRQTTTVGLHSYLGASAVRRIPHARPVANHQTLW
jgi:hypothetical protein